MTPESRLIVVEHIIGPAEARSLATLMDLNMMVVTGGRVRTSAELKSLLEAAGFVVASVMPTPSPLWVIEALPIDN